MTRTPVDYAKYLRSKWWKARRLRAIRDAGFICAGCGRKVFDASKLQVHHRNYERVGCEREEDLEVMCRRCHRRISTW